MGDLDLYGRLFGLERPQGTEARTLVLGPLVVRIEGLSCGLATRLDRRWGGFLRPAQETSRGGATLRVFDAGRSTWLPFWRPGELYRLEAVGPVDRRAVASYHFALAAEAQAVWRVGLSAEPAEPDDRVMDNVARFLTARLVVPLGGFAMHAAAVERGGRAFVLAGPSRAGKTTATGLIRGARSLGDDFAVVLPGPDIGWIAPALPFDNAEGVRGRPQAGEFPVAGIWRLSQDPRNAVEALPPTLAVAALVACVAFPWAMPEAADSLLANARRFVETGVFGRLHFARDADLGSLLDPEPTGEWSEPPG